MTNNTDTQLQSIDTDTLTPLVRQALGSEMAEVAGFQREEIHGGYGGAEGVHRFTGSAQDQDQTVPWSLILKVIGPRPDRDDPSHPLYWKREVLAYGSGLLDDLPGGLAAPRCLDIVEQPGGQCWLWLEEVSDAIGALWPIEHYGLVARHLGQFNGAYLTTRSIPSYPWLSRGWLRAYIAQYVAGPTPAIAQVRDAWEHPFVQRTFSPDGTDAFFRLYEERDAFFDALDRLPQTLCHYDAFSRNLFARRGADGEDETVAIDWSFMGIAALGEEIVPLVFATLGFGEVDPGQADALEEVVFTGYLDGLENVGWQGDPCQVRLGFTAGAIRYVFAGIRTFLAMLTDEERRAQFEQQEGYSMEEIVHRLGQVRRFNYRLIAEARELMNALA